MQVEEEELLCDICLQGYIQEAGRNPLGHDRCQICTRSMPTAPSARWYTNSFLLVVIQLVEFRTSKAICRIPRSGKDMVKNLLTMKRETYQTRMVSSDEEDQVSMYKNSCTWRQMMSTSLVKSLTHTDKMIHSDLEKIVLTVVLSCIYISFNNNTHVVAAAAAIDPADLTFFCTAHKPTSYTHVMPWNAYTSDLL